MKRVDYLHARIGQLRHRKVPYAWAVYLARLEQGERPAGQKHVKKMEPRRLFQMVRADLHRQRGIQWRSPRPIDDVNGRMLAILLRVLITHRPDILRTAVDGVAVLTTANVDAVAPVYSFFADPLNSNRPPKVRAFEYWLLRHQAEIAGARQRLLEYVDQPDRAGFASYDG